MRDKEDIVVVMDPLINIFCRDKLIELDGRIDFGCGEAFPQRIVSLVEAIGWKKIGNYNPWIRRGKCPNQVMRNSGAWANDW